MSCAYTLKTLKSAIRKYGGKVSGNKKDLIIRLDRLKLGTATEIDFPYGRIPETYKKNEKKEKKNKKFCDVDCCICMERVFVDECKETVCNHIFHESCLNRWLEESSSCPLCRTQIGEKVVQQTVPDYYLDEYYEDEDEDEEEEVRYNRLDYVLDDVVDMLEYSTELLFGDIDPSRLSRLDRVQHKLYVLENEKYMLMVKRYQDEGELNEGDIRSLNDKVFEYYHDVQNFERFINQY
jgi:hypothetical protein